MNILIEFYFSRLLDASWEVSEGINDTEHYYRKMCHNISLNNFIIPLLILNTEENHEPKHTSSL